MTKPYDVPFTAHTATKSEAIDKVRTQLSAKSCPKDVADTIIAMIDNFPPPAGEHSVIVFGRAANDGAKMVRLEVQVQASGPLAGK